MSELPDLSACDREPIHIPGSIQPHGVLLVVDAATAAILQVSENIGAVLGLSPEAARGAALHEVLDLPALAQTDRPEHSTWWPVTFPQAPDITDWYAAVHAYPDRWLIEVEPRLPFFDEDPAWVTSDHAKQLQGDATVERAAARTARRVRNVLGYDRVMVYRFDRDWHGEVVAEARRDDLEAYLGLHYPATDIPVQARALYLRNRVRQISNCRYVPARILPVNDPLTGAATDLSDVSLRSVSPVHLEYLGNMGVTASLVASIIVDGRLWGLISCHHYSPLFADHRMRNAADGIASAFAARVAEIEELADIEMESSLATVREKLMTAFDEHERIDPALLTSLAPALLEVVDADGVAIFAGDKVMRHGHLPDATALLRIRQAFAQDERASVQHTDDLGARHPELAESAITDLAAGVIFMSLGPDRHDAILWTRTEQVRHVRWGGNPALAKLETIPGARLSPRQSFETWQETVRGRSTPWSRQHLESAHSLGVLIETIERTRKPPTGR